METFTVIMQHLLSKIIPAMSIKASQNKFYPCRYVGNLQQYGHDNDPSLARFTSADTLVPPGPQGLDRYAYVNNNPVRYTDPSGHIACSDSDECASQWQARNKQIEKRHLLAFSAWLDKQLSFYGITLDGNWDIAHKIVVWRGAELVGAAFAKASLNAADKLNDLRSPPGNRLETLKDNLKGFHSIRVNDQWRLVFRWEDGAHDVSLTDFHQARLICFQPIESRLILVKYYWKNS